MGQDDHPPQVGLAVACLGGEPLGVSPPGGQECGDVGLGHLRHQLARGPAQHRPGRLVNPGIAVHKVLTVGREVHEGRPLAMLGVLGSEEDRVSPVEAHRIEVVVVGVTECLPSGAHEEGGPGLLIDFHQVGDHPLPAGQLADGITGTVQNVEVTPAASGRVPDDLLAISRHPDVGRAVVHGVEVDGGIAPLLHQHRALARRRIGRDQTDRAAVPVPVQEEDRV